MPPIVLWPSLIVCAGFGLFFTAGSLLWLANRYRAARTPGGEAPALRSLAGMALFAAVSWLAVYRIFHPL